MAEDKEGIGRLISLTQRSTGQGKYPEGNFSPAEEKARLKTLLFLGGRWSLAATEAGSTDRTGYFKQALNCYSVVIDCALSLKEPELAAQALAERAIVYKNLGEPDLAASDSARALRYEELLRWGDIYGLSPQE